MYRIVAHNPNGSTYTIYDPVGAGALPVLAPRTTEELNEAGSLELALVYGHPAFDNIHPKKTYVTVELDGTEFFYGRLLNAEPNPLLGQIQYTFAGALSLLQDSELPPDPKNEDGSMDSQTMTAEQFFRRCINNHNSEIGNDTRRQFTIGTISHSRKNDSRLYQISSYTETLSALKQFILDRYGGFLRVRKTNSGHVIDWVEQYGSTDNSTLELGTNIISMSNRFDAENIYTSLRPVGKNNLVLSGTQTLDIFPSAEMAEYGKIVRSMSFPNAETEEELRTAAQQVINRMQKTVHISSEIHMVDMHFADSNEHPVNLGDVFTGIVGLNGLAMTTAARSRDFENPQNDSVSLKSPKEFEGDESGEEARFSGVDGSVSSSMPLSKQSARGGGGGGMAYKYIHEFQDRLELNAKEIGIYGEMLELHADKFIETANEFARISHVEETMEGRLGIIEGTGVIQNSEHITQIAGKFQYDMENGILELIEGSELKVHDKNGVTITVGTRLTDLTSKTATFEGSALWTQRNSIVGVCGEFDVETVDGQKKLVIKSGGGIAIRRNNVEFGLYDSGTLTGGILVDKINLGSDGKKIEGTRVNITADQVITGSSSNVAAWMTSTGRDIGDLRGLIADRATIADLEALSATVTNLNAEWIRATTVGFSQLHATNASFTNLSIGSGVTLANGLTLEGNAVWFVTLTPSGNSSYTLTETKLNGSERTIGTFSCATTLTGVWSGSTYTVTPSPQNKPTLSVTIAAHLSGTAQYANFTAAAGTYDGSGNFISHATTQGYLKETVSGANSYVDVNYGSQDGTTVARISTADTYRSGYGSGWNAAVGQVSRSGNTIYGPIAGQAYGTTKKEVKYIAKLNQAEYTASEYTKEVHSYVASTYTKEAVSYSASSYTKEVHSYTASSYTKESVNYTASSYTAATHSYTASKYTKESHSYTPAKMNIVGKGTYSSSSTVSLKNFTGTVIFTQASHTYSPSSYTASKHSYSAASYSASSCTHTASKYTPSAHSYTASKYTASSCTHTASKYTPSAHSYTPSSYKASEFTEASIEWV